MHTFPKDFFWGAASSATQTEGRQNGDNKGENIWDYSSKEYNHRFYKGVTTDSTSLFYKEYKEDIQRMSDIHLNSFRTSISWSRLIPEGIGEINQEAVDFYNGVIDTLIEKNIEPFINLYHFDMPMALQNKGGFENREIIDAYKMYAKTCFELFGD